MTKRFALLALTAGLTVAIFTVAASAGPPGTSSGGVEIQAEELKGVAPNGSPVTLVQVKAVVEGEDASSLAGELLLFIAGGAHSYAPVTGSLVGYILTLSGV